MPSDLLELPKTLSVKILPRCQRLQSRCVDKLAAAAADGEATVQPLHCQAVQPPAVVHTAADGSDKLCPGEQASSLGFRVYRV